MNHTSAHIEAILFATAEPMSARKLVNILDVTKEEVENGIEILANRLKTDESGLRLIVSGDEIELVTSPETSSWVKKALKQDIQGELTKPSLEALTILAYRGPMTRPELEQIRGVQSSMILRNLMMRGLVEMKEEGRLGQHVYAVTVEFLKHLGISNTNELPDFKELSEHAAISDVLSDLEISSIHEEQNIQ